VQPNNEVEDVEVCESLGEVQCGSETALLVKLDEVCRMNAKKRTRHLRKEQVSQGVLKRLLLSLGRFSYEEVWIVRARCWCG